MARMVAAKLRVLILPAVAVGGVVVLMLWSRASGPTGCPIELAEPTRIVHGPVREIYSEIVLSRGRSTERLTLVSTYDEKRRPLVRHDYDGLGRLTGRVHYHYTSGGLSEMLIEMKDNHRLKPLFRRRLSFDRKKREVLAMEYVVEPDPGPPASLVEKVARFLSPKRRWRLEGTSKTVVDKDGRIVRSESYDAEKRLRGRLHCTYDTCNTLLRDTFRDPTGRLVATNKYRRDRHGNVIEERRERVKGKSAVSRHEYEYDSHGNWTNKTTLRLDTTSGKPKWTPSIVNRRTITYYPQK